MSNLKEVSLEDLHKAMQSGKEQLFTAYNKQTGLTYIYKTIQATYDPIDPLSKDIPPVFIMNYIGDGEWVYMGALYGGRDYNHYEESVIPNDYPCTKVFRYLLKLMVTKKTVAHIIIIQGQLLYEGEFGHKLALSCEQMFNMQYGNTNLNQNIVAGVKAEELANNFIKRKNYNQLHKYLKNQIA